MTKGDIDASLAAFPMGPKVRAFLQISTDAYRGDQSPPPDEAAIARFELAVFDQATRTPPTNEEDLVDLLDELVAMNLPQAVLALRAKGDALWSGVNFRGELAVGVAAMLSDHLEQAEESFRRAQELVPNEPAPYVNMALIALASNSVDDAREWAAAGLEIEPNNYRLWEVFAESIVGISGEDHAAAKIRDVADQVESWAGYSLAADLEARGDTNLKAKYLQPFYVKGLRDGDFLVEYTAALGMASDYEQIPQIVWDAERTLGAAQLPWQLFLHAAQAHFSQNRIEEGLAILAKAERHPGVSTAGLGAAKALRDEVISEGPLS